MALTTEQNALLKLAIQSDPALSVFPDTEDGNTDMAQYLNKISNPSTNVWRTNTPTAAIFDAILWDRYTPNATPDDTTLFTNRVLTIQIKQMNLQNMLIGRETIDSSRPNVRAGLRDAVINIPSGTDGAGLTAGGNGGVNVLNACIRPARNIEVILLKAAAPSDTTGPVQARVLGYEGTVTSSDVSIARNN